ncbi:MAG: ATP-binding protein [Bryobacteraceae bacterium]
MKEADHASGAPGSARLLQRIHMLFAFMTLRARILVSFIVIILLIGGMFASLGVGLIHRTLPRLQDILPVDLSAAQELYRQHVARIADASRLMAQRRALREAAARGAVEELAVPMQAFRQLEDLDVLILTDVRGLILFPASNRGKRIAAREVEALVQQALRGRREVSGSVALTSEDLAGESPELAERARIDVVPTPHAAVRDRTRDPAGLLSMVAVPVAGDEGGLLGALCAGRLLNRRNEIVDRIRNNLYREEQFESRDVAIASLFLGDVRIATTAKAASGEREVGTLISADVYEQVIRKGERWVQPGRIQDEWYLTAYEPIRDVSGRVIGAIGFGLLERKFEAAERRAIQILFVMTGVAVLLAIAISYLLSISVMRPVNALVRATERVAAGSSPEELKLEGAPPEIVTLGNSFNKMAAAIRARDQQLHRQTHEKLMRSDRLAMIGQLAAGVAHEINNPLGSILLFSRLIIQQVPAEGRVRENLDRIEKETKRCHSIVRSLLDFARERKPLIESLDVNQVLDTTLKLFEGQFLFQNIQVVRDYGAGLAAVEADQSQLQQVFMNIILNAVDAMNGKGRLVLATREGESAGFVDIHISDTGCGIPPENLERIFDPFFTTKGVGHGTGLGLSVSYGIIQAHGGDISVTSTPGSGTTFTISLPATRGSR